MCVYNYVNLNEAKENESSLSKIYFIWSTLQWAIFHIHNIYENILLKKIINEFLSNIVNSADIGKIEDSFKSSIFHDALKIWFITFVDVCFFL